MKEGSKILLWIFSLLFKDGGYQAFNIYRTGGGWVGLQNTILIVRHSVLTMNYFQSYIGKYYQTCQIGVRFTISATCSSLLTMYLLSSATQSPPLFALLSLQSALNGQIWHDTEYEEVGVGL